MLSFEKENITKHMRTGTIYYSVSSIFKIVVTSFSSFQLVIPYYNFDVNKMSLRFLHFLNAMKGGLGKPFLWSSGKT